MTSIRLPVIFSCVFLIAGFAVAGELKFDNLQILVEDGSEPSGISPLPVVIAERPASVAAVAAVTVAFVLPGVKKEIALVPVLPVVQDIPVLLAPLVAEEARPRVAPLDFAFNPPFVAPRSFESPSEEVRVERALAIEPSGSPFLGTPSTEPNRYYSDLEAGALLDLAGGKTVPAFPPILGAVW